MTKRKAAVVAERLLTTKEAAARLNVTPPRIRQLILRGQLPAEKLGRDLFIRASDLANLNLRKPGRPRKAAA